ncbi:hypothetical protein LCGC14_2740890 [marine sediment metagenome]|uniref:Uncharacterized protein n=1 Tax=marine sediment metagenome TaxID=412755 RepID=A0A0F8Z4H5_9ZZZZ
MIDPQRRKILVKAQARVLAAIGELEPEEQDHVLDSSMRLLGYSRPVVVSDARDE